MKKVDDVIKFKIIMKNKIIIISLIFPLLFINGSLVLAQEEDMSTTAPAEVLSQIPPEETITTISVEPKDLEVKESKVLPDNPLYFFKRLTRNIRQILTVNPIKKAELRLKIADEKFLEAKQLIEQKGTTKAVEIANNIINEANSDFEAVFQKIEKVKQQGDILQTERVEKFLDKIVDHSLKHQVLLQKLENQVPQQAMEQIEKARELHLERFAAVMTKVAENPEAFIQKLPEIIEQQRGDLKELKAIEILKEVGEKVPAAAKGAIQAAQEKIKQRIIELPQGAQKTMIQNYAEFAPGNPVLKLEILEKLKDLKLPAISTSTMETLKKRAIEKIGNIQSLDVLEKYQKRLENIPELKSEIQQRTPEILEKIEKIQQERMNMPPASSQKGEPYESYEPKGKFFKEILPRIMPQVERTEPANQIKPQTNE